MGQRQPDYVRKLCQTKDAVAKLHVKLLIQNCPGHAVCYLHRLLIGFFLCCYISAHGILK